VKRNKQNICWEWSR